jgi:hypothetical protein
MPYNKYILHNKQLKIQSFKAPYIKNSLSLNLADKPANPGVGGWVAVTTISG